jgi:hypothetical protein
LCTGWKLELRKVFALLLAREFPVLELDDFIGTFTMHGQPINPREQQDAMEFMQIILDLPDGVLQPFHATLIHKYRGVEIPFSSEVSEPVFPLSLSLGNVTTLNAALDALAIEEIIPNYVVDTMGQQTTVRHTVELGNLPDILFIQLDRFHYDAGKREKICKRFEFPLQLELKRCSYRLVGVLLHFGTAEIGHFYTIGFNGEWYNFNDADVFRYAITGLPLEAFGRDDDPQCHCAYILCYFNSDLPKQELLPESLHLAREAGQKMRRTALACSPAFHRIAITSQDPAFLYLYFFNIVMHMSDAEKCHQIRLQLTQSMLATGQSAQIAQLLAGDSTTVVMLYHLCHSFDILTIWTDFLKSLVRNAPAVMCVTVSLLLRALKIYVSIIMDDVVGLFVDVAQAFVSLGPAQLNLAQSTQWHVDLILFLFEWYKSHTDFSTVNFAPVFKLLMYFVPAFTPPFLNDLQNLSDFIVQSPAHAEAFFELLQCIGNCKFHFSWTK